MYYLFRFGYLCVYCLHVRFYVFTKEEEKAESRSFYFLFFILKIPENFLSSWGWSFLIFWLLYVLYIYSFMSTYARQDQLIKPAILCVCVRQLWDNWKRDTQDTHMIIVIIVVLHVLLYYYCTLNLLLFPSF